MPLDPNSYLLVTTFTVMIAHSPRNCHIVRCDGFLLVRSLSLLSAEIAPSWSSILVASKSHQYALDSFSITRSLFTLSECHHTPFDGFLRILVHIAHNLYLCPSCQPLACLRGCQYLGERTPVPRVNRNNMSTRKNDDLEVG
jgi:hypothetical protein